MIRKYFYILIGFFIAFVSGCDSVNVEPEKERIFVKMYGGEQRDEGVDVLELSDGGYVILGNSYSNYGGQFGGQDIIVIRTDAQGNELWRKRLGGPGFDEGKDILIDPAGNILVVGSKGLNNGVKLGYISKISMTGELLMEDNFGDSINSYSYNSANFFNDFLFVTGKTSCTECKKDGRIGTGDSVDILTSAYQLSSFTFLDTIIDGFQGVDEGKFLLNFDDSDLGINQLNIAILADASQGIDGQSSQTGDFVFLVDAKYFSETQPSFNKASNNIDGYLKTTDIVSRPGNNLIYYFAANYYSSLSDPTPEQRIISFRKEPLEPPQFISQSIYNLGNSEINGLTYFSTEAGARIITASSTNYYSEAGSNTDIVLPAYRINAFNSFIEDVEWNTVPRLHGFNSNDKAGNIIQTSDNGLVLVGTIGFDDQIESNNTMICLIKTNSEGFVE
ncbi:hypothetical protein OO013_00010 [Mangrovivirga sp. M17]|uniref:Lipoprotein n=1 Tax=Mangrovivirga halotolerans TaxID=2993936 RepID=A0ABT3RL89_9BACT|nr:SBBP repeat-containing protein [Mangrovivirga halotolerans]MCX2742221.1 hypothetical protein [Mangrovivirga halotolerans]